MLNYFLYTKLYCGICDSVTESAPGKFCILFVQYMPEFIYNSKYMRHKAELQVYACKAMNKCITRRTRKLFIMFNYTDINVLFSEFCFFIAR